MSKNYIKRGLAIGITSVLVSLPLSSAFANDVSSDINPDKSTEESTEESKDLDSIAKEVDLHTSEEGTKIADNWEQNIKENGFKYDINKNLSQDQIEKRYNEISEKYDLYELLSNEDSEFMIGYRDKIDLFNTQENTMLRAGINQNRNIKTVKKSQGGVTAQFSGSLFHKGGSAFGFSQYYGGNLYLKILGGASKVTSVKGIIYHEAWGIAGEQGVIKVYNDNIQYTKSKAPFASSRMDRSQHYTAYVTLMKTYSKMIVNHKGGSFELYGSL